MVYILVIDLVHPKVHTLEIDVIVLDIAALIAASSLNELISLVCEWIQISLYVYTLYANYYISTFINLQLKT